MNETHTISQNFIIYLEYIQEYIQCNIDFELLMYLSNNKNEIKIIDNSELFANLSFSVSSSSDDLENKITKMLQNDIAIINKIVDLYNNNDMNIIAKNIFDMLDYDEDEAISALDLLIAVDNNSENNNDNPIFTYDFINSIINLLINNSCEKIPFDIFVNNFV
jgi:hypothetical protein